MPVDVAERGLSATIPRDPGLQPERTAMAWLRSALVLLGFGVFMLRIGVTSGKLLPWLACAMMLSAAAAAALWGRARPHLAPKDDVTSPRARRLVCAMVTALVLAASFETLELAHRILVR